ncbi:SDR family NAD(P)-dependent oxidoreductase [Paroceanicella profunda]|uniref:SDR family NAD(P)-dependent oxidoreductase n=1 Tax=Paroceanicella profunda TaxID=2579971 RepID=A0A5B8FW52_9RHOB|nr:SDR family NAD(P)-dependent oxidoreductase [Paroceanicella profunda]QDL91664.1 SDR family NAD(P)-dependent oxidoreductase [Paroceanicella profunda]
MEETSWGTVWITGASSGIGAALAGLMAGRSDRLAISARSGAALGEIAAAAPGMLACPLDVTDRGAVAACVAALEADGPIDLAVLNAGTWALMESADLDASALRRGMEVNYLGVVNALEALLPHMLARGAGHIAITASVAGYRGLPKSVAYGPTKAALINLAETLRCELAPRGITVTVICPGFVDTPMTRDNPFPMPSIVSAQDAAREILRGLERKAWKIAFPRGFARVMALLRVMPDALYFHAIRRFVMKGEIKPSK